MTEPRVGTLSQTCMMQMWKASRMRMKFELDKHFQLVPLRDSPRSSHLTTHAWETKGEGKIIKETKICEVLCIFSFKCMGVNSGKVEYAFLLALLFRGFIPQNTQAILPLPLPTPKCVTVVITRLGNFVGLTFPEAMTKYSD